MNRLTEILTEALGTIINQVDDSLDELPKVLVFLFWMTILSIAIFIFLYLFGQAIITKNAGEL